MRIVENMIYSWYILFKTKWEEIMSNVFMYRYDVESVDLTDFRIVGKCASLAHILHKELYENYKKEMLVFFFFSPVGSITVMKCAH